MEKILSFIYIDIEYIGKLKLHIWNNNFYRITLSTVAAVYELVIGYC